MTTEISPLTGLPSLPDGFRWAVSEYDNSYSFGLPWYHFKVSIQKRVQISKTTSTRRRWRVTHEVTELERWDKVVAVPIEESVLTPELVRTAANAAVSIWDKERQSEALLGTYPPKALPIVTKGKKS